MQEKLSVVIPCYNAEHNIRDVIARDINIFTELGIADYEFVLVNDCSHDRTWDVVSAMAMEDSHITGVNLAKNSGQHAAIMAGFHYVSGNCIVVSDDDGQTQMEMIGVMLDKLREGYDAVSTKWVSKEKRSLFRRMGSWLANKVNEILIDQPKDIPVSIFFLARKYIVDEIKKYENPYPYMAGLLLRTTHNIATVEVEQLPRKNGVSGYSFKKLLGLWMNGFTAFSVVPLRIATYIGVLSATVGFTYGVYIVVRRLLFHNIAAGWSSTVAVMLFMSGVILCVLGLVGEYVGRIYMCINNTPQYVVKEVAVNDDGKTKIEVSI